MSEEEKKALEYLRKNVIVRININKNGKEKIIACGNAYKYTILNLIEKQQKEIENLKEINKKLRDLIQEKENEEIYTDW